MEDKEQLRRRLEEQIAATERQLGQLKQELTDLEIQHGPVSQETETMNKSTEWPLRQDEYRRYGRQMIVEQVGLSGKLYPKRSALAWLRGVLLTDVAYLIYRPASATEFSSAYRWSRRLGLPSGFISRWCRNRKARNHRWRQSRVLQSTPPGTTSYKVHWEI